MSLPTYMEIPAECAADALLERDGALHTLALRFDPRDVRASAPADQPGEAEALAVEAVARAARAIVAELAPIMATLAAVQPVAEAVSAVAAIARNLPRELELATISLAASPGGRRVLFGAMESAMRESLAAGPPPDAEGVPRLEPIAADTAALGLEGLGARLRADLRTDVDTLRRATPLSKG